MESRPRDYIDMLWAGLGRELVGGALVIIGSVMVMRGKYWQGVHTMLDCMIKIDPEKTIEVFNKGLEKANQ